MATGFRKDKENKKKVVAKVVDFPDFDIPYLSNRMSDSNNFFSSQNLWIKGYNIYGFKRNLNFSLRQEGHLKQTMNVSLFMQWNWYFHSVKDEMYHSTRPGFVERDISSSPHHASSWKNSSCTIALINIHYVYTTEPTGGVVCTFHAVFMLKI